jgi:tetratricopeptide (TPR) repeat protein
LGKVDAASWLEAEAEASSPDLVVLEAAADMDSALDRAVEIEIEEEANVLFGDAESILDSEYLNSARQAMESGELDSALEAYSHLLDKGEGLPYLIAELEYSIDSYGQQPLLQRLLGDTYVRNGQLKKAVEVYRQALDNI